jgi:hypothetical protein
MKKLLAILLSLLPLASAKAQLGGGASFEFLNMPLNARVAGLGGYNISLRDYDVNLVNLNPALLNPAMDGHLSVNWVPFYGGIQGTSLAYAHRFTNKGMWSSGFSYINYGAMEQTDATGQVLGTFRAASYQWSVSYAQMLDNFSLGATVRLAGSSIEAYNAHAALVDIGAAFIHPEKDFRVGLSIRNVGYAFDRFTPDINPAMPLDVALGASIKPEHMPFRFSLTARHLHRLDVVYLDPASGGALDASGNIVAPRKTLGDQIARRFVLGLEFLPSKNFQVRGGYNHLIRRELRHEPAPGAAGFSGGFMMRIKAFELAYTRAWYHVAGGTNYLTITSNLNSFFTRKESNSSIDL